MRRSGFGGGTLVAASFVMRCCATGLISIPHLLTALRGLGVRSVMVEGGARVIRSFLEAARGPLRQEQVQESGYGSSGGTGGGEEAKIIDALVVTVAPTIVGEAGMDYGSGLFADKVSTITSSCRLSLTPR